ncbi:DUF4192 domain-containing protein [Cellulomonas biazotea]|uniref:DUF4192 domain-containing protein n=1 Tax=Cellulomonas biazotea TaxID=1709 RepID=A0A402DPC1_9CELL|nr:DUF4192 domain-containing protein [Cellulomonas biazotea]GCE75979.1 hypothetical protein CBZ_10350 [Cellulomonas biazotea]
MDTTTLRVSEPRELLALVPHRLGFHPRESVVAVSLRPPRGRVGVVARVDLDRLADPDAGGARARALVTLLGEDGARRALLVVYTRDDPRGPAGTAVRRAVAHVREAAALSLGDVAAWAVTSTGYLSLDCSDACCPPGGRPLRDLETTQTGARLVLAGSAVLDSRDDLARIPPADAGRRRGVARARRRWEERREAALAEGDDALRAWRLDSLAAWRSAVVLTPPIGVDRSTEERVRDLGTVAPDEPAPDGSADAWSTPGPGRAGTGRGPSQRAPWGRLEAGLADRRVRDAVLVSLVPGTGDLPERSVATQTPDAVVDAAIGRAVASIVDPARAVPPPADAARHEHALEQVVALGRTGHQAPALTLLAMLAWWRGDGARASVLLDRALADDPAHRLARLLLEVLTAAIAPGWVRRAG